MSDGWRGDTRRGDVPGVDTRRRRAEELFQKAADLPRERWGVFLEEHAAEDSAVRAEVEQLLRRYAEGSIASLQAVEDLDAREADSIGECVGPYKLLQLIGEGGFGAVYMAEQQEPVRRKVALKIIKLGMDTKQVIARFEAERQALAMMEHPNIARVFDGGATDTGRPYFVMELVPGIPITEYCDEASLSTPERLRLFVQVCRAVQHAHQKGVIHRDIKPTNVLVTLHDGTPVPKVIDFGIAKATSERLTKKTLLTEFLQFIGTPEYMSPEQAEMSGLDVDTRADVYSLGVLLYELLTGTTPFDAATLRRAAFSEIQRVICEQEPPAPSRRISTLGARLPRVARSRRAEPQALCRLIRGDLDWIVMKALEKDRTRRYETAAALGEDVEHHLNHEPVVAGPPGAGYKLRKFVRRNRVGVLTGATVGVAVLAGLLTAAIGLVRAHAEAESTKAINAFFNGMLVSVDPMQLRLLSAYAPDAPLTAGRSGGFTRNVSVAEMVRGASSRIDEAFEGKPELAATARETIGMTLRGLGHFAEAEPQLRTALEVRRRELGDEHPDTLRVLLALGDLLYEAGRPAEGESLVRTAYDSMRRLYGADHARTLSCASILAAVLSDLARFDESESLFAQTLETQRRVLGAEHRDTLATMWRWSVSCLLQQEFAAGQALAQELYDISRRTLGPDDSLNILSRPLLGWWYVARHQYGDAEAILRPGLVQCRRILGDEHPFTYMTMQCLARSLQGHDVQDEKERLYRQALAGLRETRGELHWQTLSSTIDLAHWLDQGGNFAEAEQLYRELVTAYERAYGQDHNNTLDSMNTLADLLVRVGKFDEAIAVHEEQLAIIRRHLPAASPVLHAQLDRFAEVLLCIGRIDTGRRVTEELIELVSALAATQSDDPAALNACAWVLLTCDPPELRDAVRALPLAERAVELSERKSPPILDTLALAYHQVGRNDEAVETQRESLALLPREQRVDPVYAARLVKYLLCQGDVAAADQCVLEGVASYRAALGEDNPLLAEQLNRVGVSLTSSGHFQMAEALIRDGLKLNRMLHGAEHEQVALSLVNLGDVLTRRNEYGRAAQSYSEALDLHRRLLGADHLQTAKTLHSLGLALYSGGDMAGAVEALRGALRVYESLDAEGIPAAVRVKCDLADALVVLKRLDQADPCVQDALAETRALLPPTPSTTSGPVPDRE